MKTALEGTGLPFAHFAWASGAAETKRDHGVWGEDFEKALYADNAHAERIWQGMVHWFSRSDDGADAAKIEAALTAAEIPWSLDGVDFEEDTGFLHYVWIFEAV
ncbi:MAG: hypothetical protein IJ705_02905 [Oscillospiraceae bacterium]|nr:hypothetical protein [Oscillospiraceae bacterium]